MSPSPSCDDVDPFFDGELTAEAAAAFRDHLGGCDRCQGVLHGRMLEAAALATPKQARRPALAAPSWRRWLWATAAIAATTAVVIWSRWPAPGPEATERAVGEPAGAVALALQQERGVDVRFSARALDAYRPLATVRSAPGYAPGYAVVAREDFGLAALGELERRNELHALVAAYALKGEVRSASDQAQKLPESAATLSDQAALALLEADPQRVRPSAERALSLAVRARRLDPALEQALWNEAVALERLDLTLAAAAAFDEFAARGAAGWADEARARAARGRERYERELAVWKQLGAAADAMARGGAVLAARDAERAPSVARKALHVAIAATADRARLAELAPLAAALELAPELERVRAASQPQRGPLAARFAQAAAQEPKDPRALRAIRALARQAGLEDIARAVALVIGERQVAAEDVADLEALAAAGPWWRLVSAHHRVYYLTYDQRRYAEVDLVARDAVEACRDDRTADPYWCSRILRTVAASNAETGRMDRAYELVDRAQRLADGAGERREEAGVFSAIGQIAAARAGDRIDPSAVSDAYLRESDLRLANCSSRLYRFDFPARAALDHHRFAEARRLLADADRINQTECQELRFNAEEVRLRLILQRPTQEGVDELVRRVQAIETQYPDLDAGQRLLSEYLVARARLAVDAHAGAAVAALAALRAVVAKARSLPDAGYPHAIRASGAGALAEHAARQGDAGGALASLAERIGVPLEAGCAVGINHDDRVTVVARGPDGRADAAIREVPEGQRVLGAQELLPAAMRRRLAGCERIDVLATGPYFGIPGLLGPELRWVYRSSPRRHVAPLRIEHQVVVTDVQAPADLGLAELRPMRLGAGRTLEGAAATPARVLREIADADLAVINAHGVTDANEPSAASLVLSPDPRQKGSYWLTAEQVRHARFSRSPVIILAACHAGRVQVSSEPWSLASSFLAAGARAVIAPATEIPDQDANLVFESIIRRMQAGSTPEQAVVQEREARGGRSPWLANVVVFQ